MLLKRWISGNRARQACMLRVVRLAPLNMDPELGNANQAQVRRRAHLDAGQGVEQGRTTASLGNALLGAPRKGGCLARHMPVIATIGAWPLPCMERELPLGLIAVGQRPYASPRQGLNAF